MITVAVSTKMICSNRSVENIVLNLAIGLTMRRMMDL